MADTHIKIKPVTPRVQYTGNGSTTVFPYSFPIFDESEMVVYEGDDVITTGYTVSNAGQTDGGNVTFATAPADGTKITLLRNVSIERMTDFQEGGTFRPKNINDELDRQTAFMQQVQEKVDRTLILPPTTDIDPSQILGEVERIYSSIDNVDTVANDISNVNAVAGDLTNVDAVAGDLTNIDAVAADLTNIDAVNANKTNIDAVNANKTNIDAVAGNQTNIDAVAGNATNINSVAGNATNINAAVANETNINAAVSNETNINTVAGIASDVSTVASNASAVSNVSSNMSDVNDCVTNMSAIQDAPNQAQAAADSAALSAQYANDKINQTHITNCITYIPQDIKVEIDENGKAVLKAGSKVYIPNGFEADGTTPKFDEVNVESDILFGFVASQTAKYLLSIDTNGGPGWFQSSRCESGTSTSAISSGFYYRTTDNKIYPNNNSSSNPWSLPICSVDVTAGVGIIDQVFNGFGYIGSTVFALPGVKGLMPDGRNDNGTLKNLEYTVPSVLTYTKTGGSLNLNTFFLKEDGEFSYFQDRFTFEVETEEEANNLISQYPSSSIIIYIRSENKIITAISGVITNYKYITKLVKVLFDSSYKVTSFYDVKTVFHALDYNNSIRHEDVDGQWISLTSASVASDVSLNGSTNLDFDISSFLPNDGKDYEVMISAVGATGSTSGNYTPVYVYSDAFGSNGRYICVYRAQTRTASSVLGGGTITIPVTTSRKIYLIRSTSYNGTVSIDIRAYRRIGKNN